MFLNMMTPFFVYPLIQYRPAACPQPAATNAGRKKSTAAAMLFWGAQRLVAGALDRLQALVEALAGELLFDADQLVVLADAIGARQRTGLDLAGAGAD